MSDFFDKMKDSINKGVATVSTGSKNMVEKTKLNSYIKTLEDEKKQLTEALGNKVINFIKETEEGDIPREEVISFYVEIMKRDQQIDEQKKKIAVLDAEMNQVMGTGSSNISVTCRCGHPNAVGAKFCSKCGNKLF